MTWLPQDSVYTSVGVITSRLYSLCSPIALKALTFVTQRPFYSALAPFLHICPVSSSGLRELHNRSSEGSRGRVSNSSPTLVVKQVARDISLVCPMTYSILKSTLGRQTPHVPGISTTSRAQTDYLWGRHLRFMHVRIGSIHLIRPSGPGWVSCPGSVARGADAEEVSV